MIPASWSLPPVAPPALHRDLCCVVAIHPVVALPHAVLRPFALDIGLRAGGIAKGRIVEALRVVGGPVDDARGALLSGGFVAAEGTGDVDPVRLQRPGED